MTYTFWICFIFLFIYVFILQHTLAPPVRGPTLLPAPGPPPGLPPGIEFIRPLPRTQDDEQVPYLCQRMQQDNEHLVSNHYMNIPTTDKISFDSIALEYKLLYCPKTDIFQ